MKIKAKVTVYEKENVKALASLNIEDVFIVTGLKVMDGKNGLFVVMPSYKTNKTDENGKAVYNDVAYPLTKELREEINHLVLDEYEKQKKEEQPSDK